MYIVVHPLIVLKSFIVVLKHEPMQLRRIIEKHFWGVESLMHEGHFYFLIFFFFFLHCRCLCHTWVFEKHSRFAFIKLRANINVSSCTYQTFHK